MGGYGLQPMVGTDESTIDDRGRVLITKKKRERLGYPFVLTLGEVGCLVAYPGYKWAQVVQQIAAGPDLNPGRQLLARLIVGMAEDGMETDPQGRFVIPQSLRNAAKIKKDVKIVGAIDRLEIWAAEEYDAWLADPMNYQKERLAMFEQALGKLGGVVGGQ